MEWRRRWSGGGDGVEEEMEWRRRWSGGGDGVEEEMECRRRWSEEEKRRGRKVKMKWSGRREEDKMEEMRS